MFINAVFAEHLEKVGDEIGRSIGEALHNHIDAIVASSLGKASVRKCEEWPTR